MRNERGAMRDKFVVLFSFHFCLLEWCVEAHKITAVYWRLMIVGGNQKNVIVKNIESLLQHL